MVTKHNTNKWNTENASNLAVYAILWCKAAVTKLCDNTNNKAKENTKNCAVNQHENKNCGNYLKYKQYKYHTKCISVNVPIWFYIRWYKSPIVNN